MGVLLVACGRLSALVTGLGYLSRPICEIDSLLPDHDVAGAAAPESC